MLKEAKMNEMKYHQEDAIVMAVEELVNVSDKFLVSQDNQEIEFETTELMKFLKYFSIDDNEQILEQMLIDNHNSCFTIFINNENGLYSVDSFFEFSPYDTSKATLLAESIEKVE